MSCTAFFNFAGISPRLLGLQRRLPEFLRPCVPGSGEECHSQIFPRKHFVIIEKFRGLRVYRSPCTDKIPFRVGAGISEEEKKPISDGSLIAVNQWGTQNNDKLMAMTQTEVSTYLMYVIDGGMSGMQLGFIDKSDLSIDMSSNPLFLAEIDISDVSRDGINYYITGSVGHGGISITNPYTGVTTHSWDTEFDEAYQAFVITTQDLDLLEVYSEFATSSGHNYGIKTFVNGGEKTTMINSYGDIGTEENKGNIDGFVCGW